MYPWHDYKTGIKLWKILGGHLDNFNVELLYDLAILLLGICPNELKSVSLFKNVFELSYSCSTIYNS